MAPGMVQPPCTLTRPGDRTGATTRLAAAVVTAIAALACAHAAPAAADTIAPRAATYIDAAAPKANFSHARYLRVDGRPTRRALLRFAVPSAPVRSATLRLYATGAARQRVVLRSSSCAWTATHVTSRTRPRTGRALAARGLVAKGWNAFALPGRSLRSGSTTCVQLTTSGRGLIRFQAKGRTPQLVVRRGGGPGKAKGAAPAAAAPGATWKPPLPPDMAGYCAATGATWAGIGRTIAVDPGTSLQAAVDAAAPGDTIELADGVYTRAQVTLNKAVRLRARNPFGAVLVGNATPRTANDTSVGTPTRTAVSVGGDGAMVEGLEIRYYDTAIAVDGAADVVVQGNRAVSSYGVGVELWDTRNNEVRCNELLDPYLENDPTASLTSQSISDAQMDYGVNAYGSIGTRVEHNYFHGVFNQALSFKEGNLDAYAGYNTFEGFNLTALFFGQNIPHNGPYSFTHLPVGPDRGTLVAEYNVFRPVYGMRGATPVVYYARSPIRVWHVDATTVLRGNVIEAAQQGFLLECRSGASAGCASGTILLQDNTVNGRMRDLSGVMRTVNTTAGVMAFTGLVAQVTIVDNLFAMVPDTVKTPSDGVTGTPSVTLSGGRVMSTSAARLDLRAARATTDPDLSLAAGL
jgi:parallel beta-helix repeat protein